MDLLNSNTDSETTSTDGQNILDQLNIEQDNSSMIDLDNVLGFTSRNREEEDGLSELNKNNLADDPFAELTPESKGLNDKKNFPKDPQALLKFYQSEHDKIKAVLAKTSQELEKNKEASKFLENLVSDKSLRMAFIGQFEPELVKTKDPIAFIKESLAEKFGADFTPDEKETAVFGTQSWLYNDMANQLLKEFRGKEQSFPKDLKEFVEKKRNTTNAQKQAAIKEKNEILSQLKWDETKFNSYLEWVKNVRTIDSAKIYDFLIRQQESKKGPGPLNNLNGGHPVRPNEYKQHLDSLFGK